LRYVLRTILFPWLIWDLVAAGPRWLRERHAPTPGLRRQLITAGHTLLYVCIGLPTTVLLTGEILITANEGLIGEQADYRLQSDLAAGLAETPPRLPGSPTPRSEPVPAGSGEAWRRHLVERYAPVIVQKLAHHPEWDVPLRIDFDGNDDPRDNVQNEPAGRPHHAAVYGELTAQTADSYYLTYSLYHAKDYDHPLREWFSDWTFHDNDNEGLMIRVERASGTVVQAETWFHNRFLLYDASGTSRGTEPIHGAMHFEDGTHLLVYSQPQGHGVRAFQRLDLDALAGDVKILRWRGQREAVPTRPDRSLQTDASYDLVGFDDWYAQARGPFGSQGRGTGMFEETIPLGRFADGRPIEIGRYIAGWDYSKMGWSRPKPPWSWDDGWDQIPIFVWHFFPSFAFASHSGRALSHAYEYSRPIEAVFGVPPAELLAQLQLRVTLREGDKWASLEDRGGNVSHRTYWQAFEWKLKVYLNYLWHALG
jgi:hypothetical protein